MKSEILIESLRALKLNGMASSLELQSVNPEIESMGFVERLGLLVDHETTHRSDKRLKSRLKIAKLKESDARIEEINYKKDRRLDKSVIMNLATCDWIHRRANICIVGKTGTGKTYMACAFAHRACLEGFTCRYYRLSNLLDELVISRADGSYQKFINLLNRTDLIILDDWGLKVLNDEQRQTMFELVDDRHKLKSIIMTSQLPVKDWYNQVGDPTIADAIMDRLVSASYRINIGGDSLRPESGLK